MDISSVVGIIIAFAALLTGMVLKGVSLSALANPAAILIIIFGTIAAVTIAFPMKELKRVPKLFKILFTETKLASDIDLIKMFSQWADLARRELKMITYLGGVIGGLIGVVQGLLVFFTN